jgi:hypothetical protein|tara:strand:+ start:196 stop:360 length:165 start_codon:yes stop_codon:yes gene_type:complete
MRSQKANVIALPPVIVILNNNNNNNNNSSRLRLRMNEDTSQPQLHRRHLLVQNP